MAGEKVKKVVLQISLLVRPSPARLVFQNEKTEAIFLNITLV